MSGDNYAERANQHRPKTLEAIRDTARRMIEEGCGEHIVAAALGMAVEQVRRIVGSCEDCGE